MAVKRSVKSGWEPHTYKQACVAIALHQGNSRVDLIAQATGVSQAGVRGICALLRDAGLVLHMEEFGHGGRSSFWLPVNLERWRTEVLPVAIARFSKGP